MRPARVALTSVLACQPLMRLRRTQDDENGTVVRASLPAGKARWPAPRAGTPAPLLRNLGHCAAPWLLFRTVGTGPGPRGHRQARTLVGATPGSFHRYIKDNGRPYIGSATSK